MKDKIAGDSTIFRIDPEKWHSLKDRNPRETRNREQESSFIYAALLPARWRWKKGHGIGLTQCGQPVPVQILKKTPIEGLQVGLTSRSVQAVQHCLNRRAIQAALEQSQANTSKHIQR